MKKAPSSRRRQIPRQVLDEVLYLAGGGARFAMGCTVTRR